MNAPRSAALIFANAWHWLGFPALVFLAGMQRIPKEVHGGRAARRRRRLDADAPIVWPLVAPATTIVVILTFIGCFNWFELPYVMAGLDGSPGGATDVLGLYFYRTAFGTPTSGLQDFGHGSALAVLMFLFIVVSTLFTRALRQRDDPGDRVCRRAASPRTARTRQPAVASASIALAAILAHDLHALPDRRRDAVGLQDDGGDLRHALRSAGEFSLD